MLHIHAQFEDLVIQATADGEGDWTLRVLDLFKKQEGETKVTSVELSAIMALACGFGEDGGDANITTDLYIIVEPVLQRLPKEVRPVP